MVEMRQVAKHGFQLIKDWLFGYKSYMKIHRWQDTHLREVLIHVLKYFVRFKCFRWGCLHKTAVGSKVNTILFICFTLGFQQSYDN